MRRKVEDILKEYEKRLAGSLELEAVGDEKGDGGSWQEDVGKASDEYVKFRRETFKVLSFYEKVVKAFSRVISVKASDKDRGKLEEAIKITHLVIGADAAVSFSVSFLMLAVLLLVGGFVGAYVGLGQVFLMPLFLGLLFSGFFFYYLFNFPFLLAKKWKLKAGSQMVPCLLYMVVYMRHTPNLERAVKFASDHLSAPLALDLKKVFWDVEVGKYSSIRESFDAYLETWRKDSLEFLEAIHLVESSLYEPTEAKRIAVLEKSLEVMLEGVHEKMLHYVQDVRAPLTNVYMLGLVLPTLALALLPLASALLGGLLQWHHIFVLFNLIVPFFVYYLTSQILLSRPGGYGEQELLEQNPNYGSYISRVPVLAGFLIGVVFVFVGLLPLFLGFSGFEDISLGKLGQFLDFKEYDGRVVGPFGTGALILSLFFPLGIGLFFAVMYSMKTSNLVRVREETRKLEGQFSSSLFQLGNRLGSNVPAEIAFGRVAKVLRGTPAGKFFYVVNSNIQNGMSVKDALFDRRRGAVVFFPSGLIRTSMHILVESSKKGLKIASKSMISIADYAKNIHKIDERLKDLLAEVVSSMKSNISLLAPVLIGIIVGLAAMITSVVNIWSGMVGKFDSGVGAGTAGTLAKFVSVETMIPPYFLQIAVGIYLVEMIFILSGTIVAVEKGADRLTEKSEIAKNLYKGLSLYFLVTLIAILVLSFLAGQVIGG